MEGLFAWHVCDLVERLHDLTDADQARVWALVEVWAKTKASDADKAAMREKIRVSTFSRHAARRARKNAKAAALATAGKAAYTALEPSDLLNKHTWLFRNHWIQESADEIEDLQKIDFRKREERIKNLRVEALREIVAQRGLSAILELSERGNAPWVIGTLVASSVLTEPQLQELLRLALAPILAGKEEVHSRKNLISGALCAIEDDDKRGTFLKAIAAGLSEADTVRLLVLAPYRQSTWKLVGALGKAAESKYWSEVIPDWIHVSDAENSESVEWLLKAGRPRAAFSCIRFEPAKLDAHVLSRLLSQMAQGGNDEPGQYLLEHYHVEQAFKHLDSSSALTLDQKAGLEFAFLEVLARPWDRRDSYGIPNLERYIEVHPELFVQAVVWAYKRKDGATDPFEFQVPAARVKTMAERGYKLLWPREAINCWKRSNASPAIMTLAN
jgi:hypothetical protein